MAQLMLIQMNMGALARAGQIVMIPIPLSIRMPRRSARPALRPLARMLTKIVMARIFAIVRAGIAPVKPMATEIITLPPPQAAVIARMEIQPFIPMPVKNAMAWIINAREIRDTAMLIM